MQPLVNSPEQAQNAPKASQVADFQTPKFRVMEGLPVLEAEVIKSTVQTRSIREGQDPKFSTKIRVEIPGEEHPILGTIGGGPKTFYVWTEMEIEEGTSFPLDLAKFVIKRVEDRPWTDKETDEVVMTTRDFLESRRNHISGL
jgi:hypothetical protein